MQHERRLRHSLSGRGTKLEQDFHTHVICNQTLGWGTITVLIERTLFLSLFDKFYVHFYTQCSAESLGLFFFLNRRQMRKTHTFFYSK